MIALVAKLELEAIFAVLISNLLLADAAPIPTFPVVSIDKCSVLAVLLFPR